MIKFLKVDNRTKFGTFLTFLDYQHEIRIVNKKHAKHKQIIKLINH